MINKLRMRFIRIAMLAVTMVLILLIVAVNGINCATTYNDLSQVLSMIVDNNGSIPVQSPGIWPGEEGRNQPPFTEETPFSTRYFVLRYGADGTLLGANWDHIAAVSQEDAATYVEVARKHGEGTGLKGSYIFRVTAQPDGSTLAVFLDCQRERSALRTYAIGSAGAAAGCIVLVYILILFFSRYAIIPVIQSMEKQKQFITDASHELKTPLTVIGTSQKVLEMEVGSQKWIDKTMVQVDKMRSLVDQLVTLSRLDEEHPPMQISTFDASEAVVETAESFRDYAQTQGHPLMIRCVPGLMFCGDPLSVRQLVSILVDNAVKYCAPGGEIVLELVPLKRGLQLRVSNHCTALAPQELNRLFDRFYRVDPSRSRQTGGFGVGLSIARGITELHHGSIQATCPDANTIVFTAVLNPLKPKDKPKEK